MNLGNILSYSLRIVNKNRVYSTINLLGLSLGLSVFTLIFLFVRYEFGYDRYHANVDRIYRIYRDGDGEYQGTDKYVIAAAAMADVLKESVKEADHITRIAMTSDVLVKADGRSFFEAQIFAADPDFFNIFSLDVIAGENKGLLADPTKLVICESVAIKWYGSVTNAIGKPVTAEKYKIFGDYVVQAVVRDMPFQSHFIANVILPFEAYVKATQPSDLQGFNNNNYWIYFTLQTRNERCCGGRILLTRALKPLLTNYDKPPVARFQRSLIFTLVSE
ncbi:MAG: ABC transporter permease [Bacteroidota bacterium]